MTDLTVANDIVRSSLPLDPFFCNSFNLSLNDKSSAAVYHDVDY